MENKLKINKLVKKGILIPAVLAGMLNCAVATASPAKQNTKMVSSSKQTMLYQKAMDNYSEKKAVKTLTNVINSDLNKMTGYDKLEAKVQSEIAGYLADANARSLEIANCYKAAEDHTVANSGLTPQEMDKIAINKGVGTTDQVNLPVASSAVKHFIHMALGAKTVVLFGADEAAINFPTVADDEGDNYNEFLHVIAKGERNAIKDATAVLNALKIDILNYTQYGYAVKGQDGKKMANQVANNLDKIKSLAAKGNVDQISNIVNETAEILYKSAVFGNLAMCRGLVYEYATQYALEHSADHVKALGYNTNINADTLIKGANKDLTFNPSVTVNSTNKYTGVGLGFSATKPLDQNWDITYGGEIDYNKGYNNFKGGDNSVQLFGTIAGGKTLNNGNHVSVGTKAGLQFDTNGISTPFGVNAEHTWNVNDKLGIGVGVGGILNPQERWASAKATVSAAYRTKSLVWKFSVGLGFTHDWNKETGASLTPTNPTPDTPIPDNPTPDKPTQPTYGEDEVIKPEPGTTIDKGNIQDLPEKPVDLSLF